ncbi:MAG: COG2426 family protein [Spirochaetia bacterium]
MTGSVYAVMAALSLLPISELRGAIPYGIAKGVPWPGAYFYCVFLNALLGPILFLFLGTLHRLFYRITPYRVIFDKLILRARKKVSGKVEKFGYLGVMLFVAIPFPITGAYTGTLGAWVIGLEPKRTFLAVAGGVCISGIIVTLISVFGVEALSIFIKQA